MLSLPFTALDFFATFALVVALAYAIRHRAHAVMSLGGFLLLASLGYLAVYDLYALAKVLAFLVYQFAILSFYFAVSEARRQRFVPALMMLLPMLGAKLYLTESVFWFFGFSYMTFRSIQLLLELKKPTFAQFCLFMTFTPSLLAGPIDRFSRFDGDLARGWSGLDAARLTAGWRLVALGMFQKFVLAECVDRYLLQPLSGQPWGLATGLGTAYAYYFFFYLDFAGYSAMAIGAGKMLGIDLPRNFDRPFLAENPKDFWNRFHISLGNWLKDYLFVPGYRWLTSWRFFRERRLLSQNLALYATFQTIGLWNGLSPSYFAMGLLFGTYSVVHNSYGFYQRSKGLDPLGRLPRGIRKGLNVLLMFHAACLAILLFSGKWPEANRIDLQFADLMAEHFGKVGLAPASFHGVELRMSESEAPYHHVSSVAVQVGKVRLLYRAKGTKAWRSCLKDSFRIDGPMEFAVREGKHLSLAQAIDPVDRYVRDSGGRFYKVVPGILPSQFAVRFERDLLKAEYFGADIQRPEVEIRVPGASDWIRLPMGEGREGLRGRQEWSASAIQQPTWPRGGYELRLWTFRDWPSQVQSNVYGDVVEVRASAERL